MIDARAKGASGETKVRDTLRKLTGLGWERTPGSGALDEKHKLKGDLYIPGFRNIYTVEVKNYAEDNLTSKILTSKSPIILQWWEQAIRQAKQNENTPLLIFKHNRSNLFVAYNTPIEQITLYDHLVVQVQPYMLFISLLENFIKHERPVFIK